MKNRLLFMSAICGLSFFAATPAFADCSTTTPSNGDTVTCSGITDNTNISGGASGVTVNLNGETWIDGVGGLNAIDLGANTTISATGSGQYARIRGFDGADAIHVGGGSNITLYDLGLIEASDGGDGIHIAGGGSITVENGALITSNTPGSNSILYTGAGGNNLSVTVGGQVDNNIAFGTSNATLTLNDGYNIGGNVTAGAGVTDKFILGGTADASFDTSDFTSKYTGFDSFSKTGSSTWTLTGSNAKDWTISGGALATATNNVGKLTFTGGTLDATDTFTHNTQLVLNAGGGTIDVASGKTLTQSALVSGAGALTKTGDGKLIVSATHNGAGALNLNGGIYQVANSSSLGNGGVNNIINFNGGTLAVTTGLTNVRAVNLVGDGTYDVATGLTSILSGSISGSGSFTKSGAGILTLSGANTNSGAVNITGGTLNVNDSNRLGDGSVTNTIGLSNGGILNATTGFTNARAVIVDTGGGTLSAAASQTLIQNGAISGAGDLTKAGAGAVTLDGINTNSGKIILTAGSLSVSADANLGDASATNSLVFNGGTLSVSAGFTNTRDVAMTGTGSISVVSGETFVQDGILSGTGALTKSNAGTLVLSGNNTNSGTITVTGGALSVASSSNLGNGSGTNNLTLNGSALIATGSFTNARTINAIGNVSLQTDTGVTLTQSGALSGSGTINKTGAGTLVLSGTNTYTGGTAIDGGTVNTGATASLGSNAAANAVTLSNGGTLNYTAAYNSARNLILGTLGGTINTDTFNTTLSGVVSGNGGAEGLTKTGSGTLTLSGTNTYLGTLHINGGTVTVTSSANLGNANSTLEFDGGTLSLAGTLGRDTKLNAGGGTFDVTGTSTFTGVISGTGSLTRTGGGSLTLSGVNTFSGGVFLNGGATLVSASDNLGNGSSTNNITMNNASLDYTASFDQSRNITLTGASNTFNMGTNSSTITGILAGTAGLNKNGAGTLIFSGANSYNGAITITGGTLGFDENTDRTFTGIIDGTGTFAKSGIGTLVLTGINTLTGTLQVSSGTLSVNGSAGAVAQTDVLGGTLGGTGTVANVTVANTGTLAPGNSIGQLNVNGTLAFDTGSTYDVEYDDTAADSTIATGNVTIASGVSLNLIGNASVTYSANTGPYTILQSTGGTISGAFNPVTNTLAFLDADLDYTDNTKVSLSFVRNDVTFDQPTQNATQAGAAKAVNDLGAGNPLYDAFVGLNAGDVPRAAESISGAGVIGIVPNVTPTFIQPVLTHIAAASGALNALQTASGNADPSVYTAALIEPAAGGAAATSWFQVIGGFGRTQGETQTPAQDRGSYGVVTGFDRDLDSLNGRAGIFGGWQFSDFSSDSIGASSEANSYQLGGYVQHTFGNGFTLTGGGSAMYHDIDTVRHVIVGGAGFSPHGETDGNTLTAFGEISRPIALGGMKLEGFGNLTITRNHTSGYTETEGGAANLIINDVTKTNPSTTLGVRGGMKFGPATITGSLGWLHTYGDTDNTADMRFTGGTTTFTSKGTPIARDAAVVNLKLDTGFAAGINGYAGYDGTLAKGANDHSLTLGIKAEF